MNVPENAITAALTAAARADLNRISKSSVTVMLEAAAPAIAAAERQRISSLPILQQMLGDAIEHRTTLLEGYHCSDCDLCKHPGDIRCAACQEDAGALDEYRRLLPDLLAS